MQNIPTSKPTIYPTLVLGLGGTGTKVVRQVKKRLLKTYNGHVTDFGRNKFRRPVGTDRDGDGGASRKFADELPELLQVLAVDTEPLVNKPRQQPLYADEFVFMGHFDATKLVTNKQVHAPFMDWWIWPPDRMNLGYIHNGARQMRPIGRMCFMRNYGMFRSAVQSKLRNIQKARAIAEAQEDGFPVETNIKQVYIVSSVCGGTGAGMLVDAARCVRDYVGDDARVVGILAMPSCFVEELHSEIQKLRIQANAYAVLKEIDFFQRNTLEHRMLYPNEDHKVPGTAIKAFDQIFLVEMMDDQGTSLSDQAAVHNMIAHFIQLTTLSEMSDEVLGRDANIHKMEYSAFGVSAMVLPRNELKSTCELVAENFLTQQLYGSAPSPIQDIQPSITEMFQKLAPENQYAHEILRMVGEVSGRQGVWAYFESIVTNNVWSMLQLHGIAGLQAALRQWHAPIRARVTAGSSSTIPYDVAAYNVTPKGEPPAELSLLDRIKQDKKEKYAQELDLYNRRAAQEKLARALDSVLNTWFEKMQKAVDEIEKTLKEQNFSLHASADELVRSFNAVHPPERPDTDHTFYDLETSALGRYDAELIVDSITRALERIGSSSGEVLRNSKQQANVDLYKQIAGNTNAGEGSKTFFARLRQYEGYRGLVDGVIEAIDIRDIYGSRLDRKNNRPPRPSQRGDQLHRKSSTHADLDRENNNFAGANPEPVRLVSIYRGKEGASEDFRQSLREHGDFAPVSSADPDRIDSCVIMHGIPASNIRGLDRLYHAYWGDASRHEFPNGHMEFDPERLHLHMDWAIDFDEIFVDRGDINAESHKTVLRQQRAARNGGGTPPPPSTPASPDPRTSPRRS
jgi:hypothetical protein